MKYTVPYDDKITLPHIRNLNNIGINANNLNYDKKELTGEVTITGEYSLDNENEIMEFKHAIPVSFLIDDEEANPQINISNFKYEVIFGRGIEIMFDLDVIILESVEARKEELIDKTLEDTTKKIEEGITPKEKHSKRKSKKAEVDEVRDEEKELKEFQNKIDQSLDSLINKGKIKKPEEVIKEAVENHEEENQENNAIQVEEKRTDTLVPNYEEEPKEKVQNEVVEEILDIHNDDNEILYETDIDLPKVSEEFLSTKISPTASSFDTAFIPSCNDKFTTYKIIMIDEEDDIDTVLEERNLSKALICKEYSDKTKVILKIEHDKH